jgi:hypothetical protein
MINQHKNNIAPIYHNFFFFLYIKRLLILFLLYTNHNTSTIISKLLKVFLFCVIINKKKYPKKWSRIRLCYRNVYDLKKYSNESTLLFQLHPSVRGGEQSVQTEAKIVIKPKNI